ncbi:membrane protein [Gordonia phage GTE8]|uniref:Uncharacterized protein n=1 Tax=Gordonia phage GTE8 TaxID=1647475 RepID=A0A0K0N5X8_9CAUD|nr:membrane protein [Gordonia phage GTE8]AKJ72344.1 hypothetical protein GTE8_1 [Gordonia phage GTE8]
MPIQPSGKLTGPLKDTGVGIQVEVGDVKLPRLSPDRARRIAALLVEEADTAQGRPNYRVRLRRRWQPGGVRDKENRLIGFSLGIAFTVGLFLGLGIFNEDWPWYAGIVAGNLVISGVSYLSRRSGDRKDIDDEFRERRYGQTINQSTGVLPWEIR